MINKKKIEIGSAQFTTMVLRPSCFVIGLSLTNALAPSIFDTWGCRTSDSAIAGQPYSLIWEPSGTCSAEGRSNNFGPTAFGLRVPISHYFSECPGCPKEWVVFLHEDSGVTAARLADHLIRSSPDFFSGKQLDQSVLKALFNEAQIELLFEVSYKIWNHLKSVGIKVNQAEGRSESFLEKIRLIVRLVQQLNVMHPTGSTVCEVGFNMGHSALYWLIVGASRVLSFDLGEHAYISPAATWLTERFPGRVQVIVGDSRVTVPSFHAMWPDVRCDLIFVDGGHTEAAAEADLRNFEPMANRTHHIVLMDDVDNPDVARAWDNLLASGRAVEDGKVERIPLCYQNLSPFTAELLWDGRSYEIDPKCAISSSYIGAVAYGHYT